MGAELYRLTLVESRCSESAAAIVVATGHSYSGDGEVAHGNFGIRRQTAVRSASLLTECPI